MQWSMVDFQQRWPVFAETTGWIRGPPESEQTKADMNLLQLSPDIADNMEGYFEMIDLKKGEKMVELMSLESSTRKNVCRLLNRQAYPIDSEVAKGQSRSRLYIDPNNGGVFIWNLLYLVVFYLLQLQISMSLAFGPRFFEEELQLTNFYLPVYLSFLAFILIDILINFFKGYYNYGKGKVVDDPKKIVKNYLKNQFPFDILMVLLYSIPLFHQSFDLNFLQLITAGLVWIKKFKYQTQIENFLQYRSGLKATFMLTILFIDVLMIGNYGACLYIGMDLYLYNKSYYGTGENSPYYWLTTNTAYPFSLIYGPWYYQYIYAQQFSTGTLSTLAPGPFGKNPIEIFYSIIVMIFFVVLASYVAEVLIQIAYTYTQRRIFHEDNIISFDNFMQLKNVGRSIRRRIYNFFQLVWQVQLKMETKEQQEMITKLPLYLREELLLYLYFLQRLPSENTLKKLISLKIQRSTIDSNTELFKNIRTHGTTKNIVFIKQGMAKFYLSKEQLRSRSRNQNPMSKASEIVLSLSNVEHVLGTYEFITGQEYSICCKSIDLCLIQTLTWESFQEVLAELHLQEQFTELRHRVLVERELSLIKKICVVCMECHVESECPEIYPRERFVKTIKFQSLRGQNRRKLQRRKALNQKKVISMEQLYNNNIFGLISGVNLGQLLADFYKFDDQNLSELQEVAQYHQYFKDYNLQERQ